MEMAAIEKIVEGDGVITVYFSSPYEVEVDSVREEIRRINRQIDVTVSQDLLISQSVSQSVFLIKSAAFFNGLFSKIFDSFMFTR